MKILYVTTIGGTMTFFESFIKTMLDDGHQVDIATNESNSKVSDCYREWGCRIFPIDTSRSPLNKGNLKAIKQIKALVKEHKYDIVHCHTPVAAMCARIACRGVRKNGTKVFYTAHGFHFYKGAPLKNWLLFYPIEWICSFFTDKLITINTEDFALAQKRMHSKELHYVKGVGIDLKQFGNTDFSATEKRRELGVLQNATVLLSVGELNENKNHETVIKAIKDLDVYYLIAGRGNKKDELISLARNLGIEDRVKLLGQRNDVDELYKAADIFVFPSFREGLSVSLMEAMASSLPCAVSKIRGNTDLIDSNGGALFDPHSVEECAAAITELINSDRHSFGEYNKNKVKEFSEEKIFNEMKKIYS